MTRNRQIILILLLVLMPVMDCLAGMKLLVTPTRVEFDARTRSAKVTIMNTGDSAGILRLSLVNRRMTEQGQLVEVSEADTDLLFADRLLRFSPRQVQLAPGQSQVVRIALRKPPQLAAGEYRSHLLFAEEPQATPTLENDQEQKGIRIQLKALVGISIPVIVRHNTGSASVGFESAGLVQVKEGKPGTHIELALSREGDESVYGELVAEYLPAEGKGRVIGQMTGVAIYTPGKRRTLKMPLEFLGDTPLKGGVIQVLYRQPLDKGGKVMAITQIEVP